MSTFSDLLDKAKALEAEVQKEGTVLVGEAETLLKELVQNLEHEVQKEASTAEPKPNTEPGSGVQTSSDLK